MVAVVAHHTRRYAALYLIAVLVFVLAGLLWAGYTAQAATNYLRPSATEISNTFAITGMTGSTCGGPAWCTIADAVVDPTPGSFDESLTGGNNDVIQVPTTAPNDIDTASQIIPKVYHRSVGGKLNMTTHIDVFVNGTSVGGSYPFPCVNPTVPKWCTGPAISGTWSQADIDSVQIQLTGKKNGGGSADDLEIAAAYLDLTYTVVATPTLTVTGSTPTGLNTFDLTVNVTSGSPTARGTCITTSNPGTGNVCSSLQEPHGSMGNGSFTHGRSGLLEDTTYWWQGYATNGAGTGYTDVGVAKPFEKTFDTPFITGVVESGDPITEGDTITFTVNWADNDQSESVNAYVCKTDSITPGSGCDAGTWASDGPKSGEPLTPAYDTSGESYTVKGYWVYVCDDENHCSDATPGTFTVIQQTLTISSLTATPSATGDHPLTAVLNVTVTGGTASGPMNYSFWWDCDHTGNSVNDVINGFGGPVCGNPASSTYGAKYDGAAGPTQATGNHIYSGAGTYTGKVIVERGNATEQTTTVTITVNAVDPLVDTPTDTSYTLTTATLGANVTDDGGTTLNETGVVWSSSDTTPTIGEGGAKVVKCPSACSVGVFTQAVTGLPEDTTIYYRGYATNSFGTKYSVADSFKTLDTPSITSVVESGDPITEGDTITFTVNWSDNDSSESANVYVCKTAGITPGTGCDGGVGDTWASDGPSTGALTPSYDTSGESYTVKGYWVYVCDDENHCSDATPGTFTVIQQTLTISSLTATPSATGDHPLTVALNVTVTGGTASGPMNYSFWWDCDHTGNSVNDVINGFGGPVCGNPASSTYGAKYDGAAGTTQATGNYVYPAGTYTGKVIVERGNATEQTTTVTVTVTVVVPSITSPTHTGITKAEATLGANVTNDGGAALNETGVVWSSSDTTPTIGEGGVTKVVKCSSACSTGVFTKVVTGLPENTTIYYRGYATNNLDTEYVGSSFITPANAVPTVTGVTDGGISDVGGQMTLDVSWDDADMTDTVKAYVCKTDSVSSSTGCASKWVESISFSGSSPIKLTYTTTLSDIGEKDYYAFVCDDDGACDATSFEGSFIVVDIATNTPSNVGDASATLNGYFDTSGAGSINEVYFRYRTTTSSVCTDDNMWGAKVGAQSAPTGMTPSFTYTLTGLGGETQHWYCAFARHTTDGTADDDDVQTFTTLEAPNQIPSVGVIQDWVGGAEDGLVTVGARVTTFDTTYRSGAANLDATVEGEVTIAEIGGQPGEYEAAAQLDSRVFDTRALNGAAPLGLTWSGTIPNSGAGTYILENFAYNENIGLIGMNCLEISPPGDCSGASGDWKVFLDADDGEYHGWAWSDTIGWIAFNCDNTEITSCGTVNFNVSEDVLGGDGDPRDVTGWAWSDIIGWIAFSCDAAGIDHCDDMPSDTLWDNGMGGDTDPEDDSVWVDAAGEYHGWAWSDSVGWISFDCANGGAGYTCPQDGENYKVTRGASGGQTRVRFWVASSQCPNAETDYPECATAGTWEFRGSTCAIDGTAYETSGAGGYMEIPPACYVNHWNQRYFRYRVQMCSFDDCITGGNTIRPTVENISINWLK